MSQALLSEAPGPGVAAPGMQNVASVDTALINRGYSNLAGGKLTGLLGTGMKSPAGKFAAKEGMSSLMQPPQQPPPPQRPPRPPPMEPMPLPYGNSGLSEEDKQRLRMQGFMV
jgi:hypothetical protein